MEIVIEPSLSRWGQLAEGQPQGMVLGRSLGEWRERTRRELGLPTDQPIFATGHEPELFHPGIMAKYVAVEVAAERFGGTAVNLVVDHHLGEYGVVDVPVLKNDETLVNQSVALGAFDAKRPMSMQQPMIVGDLLRVKPALPSVERGLGAIVALLREHGSAHNASEQFADVNDAMMQPWLKRPMQRITATQLVRTSLARAVLEEMAREPWRCAEAYNRAVGEVSEAGIGPLLVRDDRVELPLWRVGADGVRHRAADSDVEAWLEDAQRSPALQMRAILLTAIMRLAVCDVFVHGMGGAVYDHAMERWMELWLGVSVSPMAMATATLRLPLLREGEGSIDAGEALARFRRKWHDPAWDGAGTMPSAVKREKLEAVNAAARGSDVKRDAFLRMHEAVEGWREERETELAALRDQAEAARRMAAARQIAQVRTWPVAFYEEEAISAMVAKCRELPARALLNEPRS